MAHSNAIVAQCRPAGPPVVELEGVSLGFGGRTLLEDLSLTFRTGEVVGLIGPGGCGKTQLLHLIATLRGHQRGKVTIFGERLRRLAPRNLNALRRRIGLQFQNFALFDYLTVAENVAFPLVHGLKLPPAETAGRVGQSLARVGLAGSEPLYPSDLSGGMRRRTAIARVMAATPELAIFDDPVAGLDPVNSAKIMALLADYAKATGALVLIATHDLHRLLPVVSRVVALFHGRCLFDGPPSGLAASGERLVCEFARAGSEDWSDAGGPR